MSNDLEPAVTEFTTCLRADGTSQKYNNNNNDKNDIVIVSNSIVGDVFTNIYQIKRDLKTRRVDVENTRKTTVSRLCESRRVYNTHYYAFERYDKT